MDVYTVTMKSKDTIVVTKISESSINGDGKVGKVTEGQEEVRSRCRNREQRAVVTGELPNAV